MSSVSLLGNSTINYDGTNFTINDDPTTYIGPLTVETSLNEQITVLLNFTAAITTNTDYIIININNVIFDGQNSTIIIDTTDYPGLFAYNDLSNLDTVIIQNISINVTNNFFYNSNAGWICSNYFFNTVVNNCSSNGHITYNAGGIFGSNNTDCIANNCYSTGDTSSGGIFGRGNIGCIANNCYSTGDMLTGSCGGIFDSNSVGCVANNCYSTGDMINGNGGIFGSSSINCVANNCYSTGAIINNSGGIFSGYVVNCTANNCYSIGNVMQNSGGIFAAGSNSTEDVNMINIYCHANNCYSFGNIIDGSGGIFGPYCNEYNIEISNCYANNCYSLGNIISESGGIFGRRSNNDAINSNCYAINCYSIGEIGSKNDNENGNGGIFGGFANQNCNANFCASYGKIYDNNGGIFGDGAENCNVNNCYSLGSLGSNSGGIFSSSSMNCTINNCYVLGPSLFGSDAINLTVDLNSVAENGNWNDDNALVAMNNNIDSNWLVIGNNIPFLLSSFTNINYAIPIGYQYFYNLTDMTPITTNGEKTLTFITGFYKTINNDNTTTITSGMYGYNIITKIITVNITGGGSGGSGGSDNLPPFLIPLLDKEINFNPEWFD
jgi:hypothetical protein